MKKVREKRFSNIIAAVIALCFCTINLLSANNFYGSWYFNLMIILYSFGIILGISYLILSIIEFKNEILSFSHIILFIIICLFLVPVLIFQSINYYKDFFNGVTDWETDLYGIPLKSYAEQNPDEPKVIYITSPHYQRLPINDEIYFDLINNNPMDKSEIVHNPVLDQNEYRHLHHIRVKFYKYTEIVDDIQILYDQN